MAYFIAPHVTTKPRKLISTLIYHMKATDTVATCDTGFFYVDHSSSTPFNFISPSRILIYIWSKQKVATLTTGCLTPFCPVHA